MRNLFSKQVFTLLFTLVIQPMVWADDSNGGYLFAHMIKADYGSLYYSYSEDGLHWTEMNEGKPVSQHYRGHPDICKGRNGEYFQIGVEKDSHEIILWESTSLLNWNEKLRIPKNIFSETPGHRANPAWWGAPKMAYDDVSDQFIITWHCPKTGITKDDFVGYWSSMRTFYVLTKDFINFTQPKKLFPYDMATIDVIIRKESGLYYAIIKDEREATADWPTGKSVRVAVSRNLEGPYAYPGGKITPSYREAPTVFQKKDGSGWYLYCEQYPGIQYHVSESPTLAGPWFDVWIQEYQLPEGARHGCMIAVSEAEKKALIKKFGLPERSPEAN